MKPRPPLPPGPYLVVGLARSGVAAALALRARGEEVLGCDAGAGDLPALAEAAGRLRGAGVEVHLDASGEALAASGGAGTLIKSPGVPQHAPVVVAARERGVPVLGELELAWRLIGNEFIAVTGTNGKTTTTEWIGHIHRQAGLPVAVAGNVGTAASSLAGSLSIEATVVCEASSFQLEDCDGFAPELAVLLNLFPDHLDRHSSYEDYVQAKLRIFANQAPDDVAVVPVELGTQGLAGDAQRVTFGAGPEVELSAQISLRGEHNRHNAMAAAAVCRARGLPQAAIVAGLRTFSGVAHRLERIIAPGLVSWVNDSKATNVASTLVALQSFTGAVHLIAGGRGKHQDFTALAPLVAARCKAVYLIGEAADELAAALAGTEVPLRPIGDLERAVAGARAVALDGDVVLLSPACASYDQYPSFEARGEHFRALVQGESTATAASLGEGG